MYGIQVGARNIVDPVPAIFNDVIELRDARLSTVVCLTSCARTTTTCKNRKHQCAKKFAVVVIERTIDKDVLAARLGHGVHRFTLQESVSTQSMRF